LAGAFLGAAFTGAAALGLAATALAGAFLAAIVALAAPAFALAGAAFFTALATVGFACAIGLPQHKIAVAAQPQALSTTTTRPHFVQLNLSPFFAFAMLYPPLIVVLIVNVTRPAQQLYTKKANFQAFSVGNEK
jgi:hypothetical protein